MSSSTHDPVAVIMQCMDIPQLLAGQQHIDCLLLLGASNVHGCMPARTGS